MSNRMALNETAYFGKGAIQDITSEIQKRGFQNIAVITDKGLVDHGLVSKVTDLLDEQVISYTVFDQVVPNPTVNNVKNGVEFVKEVNADCIIAIGGGSPIDTAKAIAIITTNPEFSDVVSLEGVADTKHACLPILAVPPHLAQLLKSPSIML